MTSSLIENFANQADEVGLYLSLKEHDLVVDIGSNDGSLLQNYCKKSKVLGIEPTRAADIANSRNISTLNMYFDEKSVKIINSEYGKARLVTACNVFAHISDIPSLVDNIDKIITDDGIFVTESHYLLDLVRTLQFDTIYHEHLRYYTVKFLQKLFNNYGFEIFRVDSIPTHGGSIRVWVCKNGRHPITKSVNDFLMLEETVKISDIETLKGFAKDVILWRNNFRILIADLISNGAKIGALGAPSRASTLLTFAGITELDLFGIGEVPQSAKLGKNMPGTRIPVITESALLSLNPSHLIILSWHIKDSIINALRNKGFKGKFIIPLPNSVVIH
jgi:hypothetical protein